MVSCDVDVCSDFVLCTVVASFKLKCCRVQFVVLVYVTVVVHLGLWLPCFGVW